MARRLNVLDDTTLLLRLDEGGVNITDGLVAYYALDDNLATAAVVDSSGGSHDGALNSGNTNTYSIREGRDRCIHADGAHYAVIPQHTDFNLTYGITMTAWVKLTSPGAHECVIGKPSTGGHAPPYFDWKLEVHNHQAGVYFGSDYVAGTVPSGVWTHIAATYDGSNARLYVNGQQVGSYAKTSALLTSGFDLRLFANGGGGEIFNGYVDECRVYNRALSEGELLRVMDYGMPAVDRGPSALPSVNLGPSSVVVSDMPFTRARQFVRATTDYLWVDHASLRSPAITIECWIKLNSLPTTGQRYFIGGCYSGYLLGVVNTGGVIQIMFLHGSSAYSYVNAPTLNTSDWFHVAFSYGTGATGKRIYLNGELVFSDVGGTLTYGGFRTSIGTWLNSNNPQAEGWDGLIADFRINDRALEPWEILGAYAAVRDPQIGFEVDDDTVCCYNFNNVSEGAVVYDDVGNHNGSVVGSAPIVAGPASDKSRRFVAGYNACSIPNHADFTVLKDFSVEVWFKPTNITSLTFIVARAAVNNPGFAIIQVYTAGHILRANMYDGSNSVNADSPSSYLVIGQWYYAVAVWEFATKTMSLYGNGSLLSTDTNAALNLATIEATTWPLTIGADIGGSYDFQGDVAAVRRVDRMLTPKEIYDYYNGSNIREVNL